MSVAYSLSGQPAKGQAILDFLKSAQHSSGALPAALKEGLTTGIDLPDGQPWLYYRRHHVGATAWLVFAEKKINPFWMGGPLN